MHWIGSVDEQVSQRLPNIKAFEDFDWNQSEKKSEFWFRKKILLDYDGSKKPNHHINNDERLHHFGERHNLLKFRWWGSPSHFQGPAFSLSSTKIPPVLAGCTKATLQLWAPRTGVSFINLMPDDFS